MNTSLLRIFYNSLINSLLKWPYILLRNSHILIIDFLEINILSIKNIFQIPVSGEIFKAEVLPITNSWVIRCMKIMNISSSKPESAKKYLLADIDIIRPCSSILKTSRNPRLSNTTILY